MLTAVERLKGSITALITPFKNGEVDEPAFTRLVEWQIAEGTQRAGPRRHDRQVAHPQP